MGRHRDERERILGPTKDRRVIFVQADGTRRHRRFPTKEAAAEYAEQARADLKARAETTLEEALGLYLSYQRAKGNTLTSVDTTEYRLRGLLSGVLSRPVSFLTPPRAAELYQALAARQRPDTHRNALKQARTFGRWLLRENLSQGNPFEGVEPLGAVSKGKPQLRLDEARKWLKVALAFADKGEAGAVAAALAFLLGLRAGEVVKREVRDLDDGGELLWVDGTKSKKSRRTLRVPEVLKEYLARQVKGKAAEARIFPHQVDWVRDWTRRICAAAGVMVVCAHSMRGLHSSLAVAAGATADLVASSLGHTPEVNRAHYTSREAVDAARQARALELLPGGRAKG